MYEFTTDWFSANIPDWQALLTKDFACKRALEIGSFEGRSACWLIENVPSLESLICIDLWKGKGPRGEDMAEVQARFNRNIARATRSDGPHAHVNVSAYASPSVPVLSSLVNELRGQLDLVYVDGSHEPQDCLADMVLSFELLRPGGLMIVDDYLWTQSSEGEDLQVTPKIAVDAFTNIYRRFVAIVPRRSLYQIYMIKTRNT